MAARKKKLSTDWKTSPTDAAALYANDDAWRNAFEAIRTKMQAESIEKLRTEATRLGLRLVIDAVPTRKKPAPKPRSTTKKSKPGPKPKRAPSRSAP